MRADVYLFEKGYAKSRQAAKNLIESKSVLIDGKKIMKVAQSLDPSIDHEVKIIAEISPYVSRGGLKLDGALSAFNVDVEGTLALDIGASTGGFTDCLLQHGARKVWAIDSGTNQLDMKLKDDPRVVVMENINARYLTFTSFNVYFDIIVMDVSFISQTLILPSVSTLLADTGKYISLIKPQFEVGRENIGKNGIVKGVKLHKLAVKRVIAAAQAQGLVCTALEFSPVKGGDGNVEFIAMFERSGTACSEEEFFKRRGDYE